MKYEKMTCIDCLAVPNDEAFLLFHEDAHGYWWYETIRTDTLNPQLMEIMKYLKDSGCDNFKQLIGKPARLYYRVCDPLTRKIHVHGRVPLRKVVKSVGVEV